MNKFRDLIEKNVLSFNDLVKKYRELINLKVIEEEQKVIDNAKHQSCSGETKEFVAKYGTNTRTYCDGNFKMRETFLSPEARLLNNI